MSSLEEAIEAIHEHPPRTVAVLTGAGVSADSGIPTFRGAGGLWRNYRASDLATPEAFERDPALVWEWYEWRRGLIREARPNAAHEAIARLGDACVITQNVDGLHARAGSRRIVELHGNIFRVRCTREGTRTMREHSFAEIPPRCACGALLRPDVVWFGEALSNDDLADASAAVHGADLVLIVGTSGVVYPAAGLVHLAKGLTIEINPEMSDLSPAVRCAIQMRAADAVPRIVAAIEEARA
ncbi:MAG TPA: NAD-dependent deacylase [Thermoanaerobaculia bacterium]|nr:NAD-dependent deacylase [Thermoanaerobaculia bacterium]